MLKKLLRDIKNKNKLLTACYRFVKKAEFKARSFFHWIPAELRSLGWRDKRYLPLKEWKDKYTGKRCFIIATGPSLTISDLEMLRNEYTFGMNSVCLLGDRTDWRPTFFGIQDEFVYEKVKDTLLKENVGQVFVSSRMKKMFNLPDDWVEFPIDGAYNSYEMQYEHRYFTKFSGDAYNIVWGGYTITYSIMQLAVYMGFKKIYLLGCDCNYQKGKPKNFIEHGNDDPTAVDQGYARMTAAYAEAKRWCDSHDVKIYNATRGGMLELFPRMRLEDVLDEEN